MKSKWLLLVAPLLVHRLSANERRAQHHAVDERRVEAVAISDCVQHSSVEVEGGHFVQGHVDATGKITHLETRGQDHIIAVSLPPEIHRLCVDKGSLAIDGISLTIAELTENEAVFWITPHTWEFTHLHAVHIGQTVNLEADMLAKYVAKLVSARLPDSSSLSS